MLQPIDDADRVLDYIGTAQQPYWREVWNRLKQIKTAVFGMIVIILLLICAVFIPFFSAVDYSDDNLDRVNMPPILQTVADSQGNTYFINKDYRIYRVQDGHIEALLTANKEDMMHALTYYGEDNAVMLDYSDKKNIRYYDADGNELVKGKTFWNQDNLFGTDAFGRDLFIRVVYGARISLLVAFVATVVNLFIGTLYGGISGFSGGQVDNLMMRFVDIISTIPLTLYVILIMVVVGAGIKSIILALSSVYWVGMARLVRGQVLSIKQQEFVLAARTLGTRNRTILLKHLLPNAIGPIIVNMTMLIPQAIFVEAFLSYIGLGVPRPMASWGTLCNDAVQTLSMYPYQLIAPAIAISITMFAFNFLGDGLRDAIDPRLKH
ncbi:ABC transporter permease [Fusibacter paucivorans]|uniref:ABC transporter permease n=2 Tax=Fusibacter paucivorans TaxID=76009 RepID=A0ABS5PSW0_9FIRM|nr:ABC transporter permease [Fusibacter paucivorans]